MVCERYFTLDDSLRRLTWVMTLALAQHAFHLDLYSTKNGVVLLVPTLLVDLMCKELYVTAGWIIMYICQGQNHNTQ